MSKKPDPQTLQDKRESVRTVDRDRRPDRGLLEGMFGDGENKPEHWVFLGWVATAAAYGYIYATWPQQWPEYGATFMAFGLALGIAMSASVVMLL